MKKLILICITVLLAFGAAAKKKSGEAPQESDRAYWTDLAYRISAPVLSRMHAGELVATMPMQYSEQWDGRNKDVAYLEAFGRLMAGIAPWLALPDDETSEGKQRRELREWALTSYRNAVDPESPDYLMWSNTGAHQTLVDAAHVALSFIHAREALWEPLDGATKERYLAEFRKLRKIQPWQNNWVLFSAMIEAFFLSIDEEYNAPALKLALQQIEDWYVGDGWYSDGPYFALDYYNSFVIHPMTVTILEVMESKGLRGPISFDLALRRMQRYNALQERLISPEATYPAMGRSMTYRMGTFHSMAMSAWKYGFAGRLSNGQVRNALTSVMKRMFAEEENFDPEGFLQFGFVGYQPDLADYYTNTGSLYITSLVFLPLGLDPEHDFWKAPPELWTSQKVWQGEPFPKDYREAIVK